ncbi:alpha/beta hydrolase [Flavobacterium sp. RSP46]|uniref:alpha/beta fold hydrolase n=1 Tax=Flavobacterium sp. RSP46 TaxID=2497486 RepID=UPI000F87D32A|nr:alpha/beta hydrolase [Flavobacterium sp. RSP46]RTY89763.1 alpha/beta hydrolase [Flavobacterium sp. RSP46]
MKKIFFLILINLSMDAQTLDSNIKNILSEYEFPTSYTTINNLEIAYIKEGKGKKTILFIHGLSSNADAWSDNIKELKSDFTCIAIDLPGFGKSSMSACFFSPTFFSEVIHSFINKMKLKNVTLIGHSMGGQASIKFATSYPNEIEKLILIAPAGFEEFTSDDGQLLKNAVTHNVIKNTSDSQIEKNYRLNFYKIPEKASKMIADRKNIQTASDFDAYCNAIVKSISGMLDEPVIPLLSKIEHKTLVIFGENDYLIPNRYLHSNLTVTKVAETGTASIKKASLKLIKESGHFVQFEKPIEVNLLIKQFVAGQ